MKKILASVGFIVMLVLAGCQMGVKKDPRGTFEQRMICVALGETYVLNNYAAAYGRAIKSEFAYNEPMSTCLAYVETSKNFEGKVEYDRRIFDLFSRATLASFFQDMQGVTETHRASPPELTEAEFNKLHDRLFPKMKANASAKDY